MEASKKPRIIYNDDSCTLRTAPQPHTLESINCALDYLKGTQVDCLCWLVGEQIAYSWPSKVIENMYDLQADGVPLAAGWKTSTDIMTTLHQQGIDYLPHLIRRAQAQGLTFVASFRMNDTHIKSYPNSAVSPPFWKIHQHYRIWDATDGKSYYNAALDYSFEEVRNRYHAEIREMATEYDVDGIELDFTRSPYFFQPSEAWDKREILTQFVRDVKAMLEDIGSKRGRPLTLILRIACLERALTTAGVDAKQWIRERLAPILVISELVNNLNQELESWRSLCREAGVWLYPAVEAGPAYNRTDFCTPLVRNPLGPRHDGNIPLAPGENTRMQRGAAQNYLAQEPDGVYMFNFPCGLAEGRNIMHTDDQTFCEVTSVLSEMGSLKTLAGKDKAYTYYRDLPIYIEANRPRRFHQTIPFAIRGADVRDGNVTLRFRQIAERNPHADEVFRQNPIVKPGVLKYYLNDAEISPSAMTKTPAPGGRIRSGFLLKRHEIVKITVPGSEIVDGVNTLAFEMPKFPHERDPYVYVYELDAEVRFP